MDLNEITNELITKIVKDEITADEFVNIMIENEIFKDKRSLFLFVVENLYNNKNNFNVVFPIAYYTDKENEIEDEGNYHWDAMTDDLINDITSQI